MGAIQIWESASSVKMGVESLLMGRGLESQIGSGELAEAICKNESIALVEQLNQYAVEFPESRKMIVEALEIASRSDCSKVIRSAKRGVSEILALSMLEALASK